MSRWSLTGITKLEMLNLKLRAVCLNVLQLHFQRLNRTFQLLL